MITLLLALAGGLGAAARFAVDVVVDRRIVDVVPWGTILVNVSGSFLLGLLVGSTTDDRWLTVLGTGFLGGYTTFSTASAHTAVLLLDRRPWGTLAHGLGLLTAAVTAAAVGVTVGRL